MDVVRLDGTVCGDIIYGLGGAILVGRPHSAACIARYDITQCTLICTRALGMVCTE